MSGLILRVPPRFQDAHVSEIDKMRFPMAKGWRTKTIAAVKSKKTLVGVSGLMFSGPPGVGKTWTMAALTRWAVAWFGVDYEFVDSATLVDRYCLFGDATGYRVMTDEYRGQSYNHTYERIPWLVINDLGKEYRGGKQGDIAIHKLGRIFRARSERMLPVFLTTNLVLSSKSEGVQTLRSVYGDSITSLLSEMCTCYQISGSDLRME